MKAFSFFAALVLAVSSAWGVQRLDFVISPDSVATLEVYLPDKPNGQAFIMCPGGGYVGLCSDYEGRDMAPWFNANGVTFAVLNYRMPHGNCEQPLTDATAAMHLMRDHAAEWGLDQIGIGGASAGGHLAATMSTLYPDAKSRPDFTVLFYPVITMTGGTLPHLGSRDSLLGKDAQAALIDRFSCEKNVDANTPPAFLMLSADDSMVDPRNSLLYFDALTQHKVPAALHVYPIGEHGWGYHDSFTYKPQWKDELDKWMRELRR